MNEDDYMRGSHAAWASMLGTCLMHLGYKSAETKAVAWVTEREAAIAALREVCELHGDNDWPEELHLADIIDKHLHRHLSAP